MFARRLLASLLAISLAATSAPPSAWAGVGVVSQPVELAPVTGAILPGTSPALQPGPAPAGTPGNSLGARRLGFRAATGHRPRLTASPLPAEPGPVVSGVEPEGPASRMAGGEGQGQSAVLSLLSVAESVAETDPSKPLSAKPNLDRAFSNSRGLDTPGAVRVDPRPSVFRRALSLRLTRAYNGVAPTARISYDYTRMFEIARRVLVRPEARKFIKEVFADELALSEEVQKQYQLPEKIKEISVSQFLLLLQHNPQHWALLEEYLDQIEKFDEKQLETAKVEEIRKKWRATFRALAEDQDLVAKFKKLNDPTEPFVLETKDGSPGYRIVGKYANHVSIEDGKEVPPADLKRVVLDFIGGAKRKLMLNVFDFDLMEVADALIARAQAGVEVTVGLDKKNMEARPEVKAVYDKLSKAKGVTVVAVDSVGLNHQKMMVRDFDDPKDALTLFSSGNLTQSCIGPEGDLVDGKPAPGMSAPNANHMLLVEGFGVAQATADNLIKTLVLKLRGEDYPLGGAFQFQGEPFDSAQGKKAAGAKEAPFLVLTFSPKGGLGDINRDITRRVLLEGRGPVRMLQFAFSSQGLLEAVVEAAKTAKKEGREFDFKSIGDSSFALQDWSIFLALSGYELKEKKDGSKEYVESKDNPLREVLGKERYEALREEVRVAPEIYREHHVKDAKGQDVKVNAKLHHKVLVVGDLVVAGTSFNFSENANSNNEQFLMFYDPALASWMSGVFEGLHRQTKLSVAAAAQARNEWYKNGGKDEKDDDGESKTAGDRPGNGVAPALGTAGAPLLQSLAMSNVLSLLALGFFLGMRHATDSDHVAAVAAIVSRSKRMGTAWLLGAFWGLGHAATILAVGAAIILFKLAIPPHVGLGLEFAVGVLLAVLGLANLAGFWTGAGAVTAHEHAHGHDAEHAHEADGREHSHPHIHTEPAGWLQRHVQAAGWAQIGRSAFVGLMHGLAGSAAVALLVLASIPDPAGALVYLLVFGVGTLAGMLFLSALMEYSMFKLTRWWKPGERAFVVLTGLISLGYGSWLIYQLGWVAGLFSSHPVWTPH